MIGVSSLYEVCNDLFADYPLAVDHDGDTSRSMILMLRDGDDARFFVLSQDCDGRSLFSLRPWRAGGTVGIRADSNDAFPDRVVSVVTCGIPIPRHGSLFGWKEGPAVDALVAVYADYTPACPLPYWAVMPLAGIPEAQWPPFAGEPVFGQWFWGYYRTGSIVSLDGLIAAVPDTVFWVDTQAILGWDSCAVARDIESPEGYTLSHGRYVYYQALRMGKPVPPLAILLADDSKTDLAPQFQLCTEAKTDCATPSELEETHPSAGKLGEG